MKFPTIEEFAKQVAEKAKGELEINDIPLDEFLIKLNEMAEFLESEIRHCENRNMKFTPFYDGEKVGFDVSKRLNERHILFCKRILNMIGVKYGEQ